MRKINSLIVHCSDTPEGKDFTVEDIRGWHVRERGWRDIGYHFVVYRDGTVHEGRDISIRGAHCKGHNKNSIGICYIGGRDTSMEKAKDTRTEEQKETLIFMSKYLKNEYPDITIYGHRDFADKDCPSFDATSEYKYISDI